ncbi:MAG: hypothetical protein PF961_09805 [Planctomycetota bacterium]|jgi:hypothetical protein|nr:hypothetical protein [Planctomycetota bacterium]
MYRIGILVVLSLALVAEDAAVRELGAPSSLTLYLDGARMRYALELDAGRHVVRLGDNFGNLVAVTGSSRWHEVSRQHSADLPGVPALLMALAAEAQELQRREELLQARGEISQRLELRLHESLGRAAQRPDPLSESWVTSLDHLLTGRAAIDVEREDLERARMDLRARAVEVEVAGHTLDRVLALPGGDSLAAMDFSPEQVAQRWRRALAAVVSERLVVVDLAEPGVVTLIGDRDDLHWQPRARLVVGQGAARLVRQALVTKPADYALPAVPCRLVSGSRHQVLAAPTVPLVSLGAEDVSQDAARTVSQDWRSVAWDGSGTSDAADEEREAGRTIQWDSRLSLEAGREQVLHELQAGPLAVLADEWIFTENTERTARRRIGLRLDEHPLLPGMLEIVVDGMVIGQQEVGFRVPGASLQLLAGEDQRLFREGMQRWPADPSLGSNERVQGSTWTLRNLGTEDLTVMVYRTLALSVNDELQVQVAAVSTAGGEEVQPGVYRWAVTIPAGGSVVHAFGYHATAKEAIAW